MSARIDRVGQRFGRLVVETSAPSDGPRARWHCRCDCGRHLAVRASALTAGNTRSCGCLKLDIVRQRGRTARHGATGTPAHRAWIEMRKRCSNPRSHAFANYGGRGIKVCERWLSFENFLADMGQPAPGLEIDRIDVDGHYEPSNCRWASLSEQANNKRNNRMVRADGRWLTLAQWAVERRVPYATAYRRMVVAAERPAPRRDHLAQLQHVDQLGVIDEE